MSQRVIAIGDIHGCAPALSALLDTINPSAEDTIVTLGDYVDRGADSRGTLQRLIELQQACQLIPILGNHDEMMLGVVRDGEAADRWLLYGGTETLASYGYVGDMSVVPQSHLDFLAGCRDFYETDTHIFLHANYDAGVPLPQQNERALRWRRLTEELPLIHMSGKKAIVGHTPDETGEIFDVGYLCCIDTFCYGGGWLTAMDVASRQIWQASLDGQLRGD